MDYNIITIGKYSFAIKKITPFRVWIEQKYRSYNDFNNLPIKGKEEIFLRWKHGFTNLATNEAVENTDISILHQIRDLDLDSIDSGLKYYFQQKKNTQGRCYETKTELGLICPAETEIEESAEIQKVKEIFGAELI